MAKSLKAFLVGAFALLAAGPAQAAGVEDFYKGKVINVVIGYSPGGGYDVYARLLARYMGRHIPGNPTLVPQNMPGAGSLKAALYIYEVAPKDGLYIGTVGRSEPIAPLLTPDEAKFDATKLSWIGSISTDVNLCVAWNSSSIKNWNDMLTKPYTVGGTGQGSDPDGYALAVKNVFGAKIKLVTPYPGTNDIDLAMERGEVDGLCGYSWSTIKIQHASWLQEKKLNLLVQAALVKSPELPDVPLLMDFATNDDQRAIVRLIVAGQQMARPFFGPPGMPEDRKQALRKAFDDTMKDGDFLAEAKKSGFDINPVNGAEIDRLLKEVYATPKDLAAKAAKAMAN
jgi:tripartite-type tricarboxylate transporter receptor subunit TctC